MRIVNKAWILVFAGFLALLSGVAVGWSVAGKLSDLNGLYETGKVIISAAQKMGQRESLPFLPDEVGKLAESLDSGAYTYTASIDSATAGIGFDGRVCEARLTGTNYMFHDFFSLKFARGGFFTQRAEKICSRAVVVDDMLAYGLFMTTDAVGKTVEILGKPFTVVGVFRKDHSLLSILADDGLPDAYVPMSVLQGLESTVRINSIQIGIPDRKKVTRSMVRTAIYRQGRNPENYNISDFDGIKALIGQRPAFIIFIYGGLSILFLVLFCTDISRKLIRDIRRVGATESAGIAIRAAWMIAALTGAVLIFRCIRFKVFIPSEYIPDGLIDKAFMGMPVVIDTKGLLALWAGLYVITFRFYTLCGNGSQTEQKGRSIS